MTQTLRKAAFGGTVLGLLSLLVTSCAQGATTQNLRAPAGFTVSEYASGFKQPRHLALAPNGDVFLTDSAAGQIYVLRDANRDGKPESRTVFASGLRQPYGMAFHGKYLYIGNTDSVVRFAYAPGQTRATGSPEKLLNLPTGGHWTRTITFGPDNRLYVAVGSSCNVCEESDKRRAAIWSYDENGKGGQPYATGLRNAVGQVWVGETLYATNNGRDQLGDNLPPEGFYALRRGGFYGWPYCYTVTAGQPQVWDKDFGRKDASICRTATPAFALVTAHSAPLGITAFASKTFPGAYSGKLFAALHGSWNRSQKSGYKVVTIDPKSGAVNDFLTGFLSGQSTLGRPVDVLFAPDGSLLVTDDGGGKIWRVQYGK